MKSVFKSFIAKSSFLQSAVVFLRNKLWLYRQIRIDKNALDQDIANFSKQGTQGLINGKQVIVSLTSFPARINEVKYAIFSLLQQTVKPTKLILWLAFDQFPGREKDLPLDLLKLCDNGLSIEWCNDIRSYKKLIPSLVSYPNALVITADDDIFYPDTFVEKLLIEYAQYPECVVAYRVHRINVKNGEVAPYDTWEKCVGNEKPSFLNFLTGAAGALYSSRLLHQDIIKSELFMKLCPQADDVWFNAMAVLNNTKVKIVQGGAFPLLYINPENEIAGVNTLAAYNNGLGGNDIQIRAVLDYYPIIKERIVREAYIDS